MPNIFGQNTDAQWNAPPGAQQWQSLGDLSTWWSAPEEDVSNEARQWAMAYEMLPYLAPIAQRTLLQWLNASSPVGMGDQFNTAQANVRAAATTQPGMTNMQNTGPLGVMGRLAAQQNFMKAAAAAGRGWMGNTQEGMGNWLAGLGSAPTWTPRSRADWNTYNAEMNAQMGAGASAGVGDIMGNFFEPATISPKPSAYQSVNTGFWR